MKPKKKETVSVQEIMNNPVDAGQKALHVRREGVLGWLSYVGYMCLVAFPVAVLAYRVYEYVLKGAIDVKLPLYDSETSLLGFFGVGLLLSILTIWKSKYPLSKKARIRSFALFCAFTICVALCLGIRLVLSFQGDEPFTWEAAVFPFLAMLPASSILSVYVCLICWYLRYFHCKAKDGYQHVWLKVLLCTLIPFTPLFWIKETEYHGGVMGDFGGVYYED